MIHLAYLIAKRDDYSNFDLQKRKSIFWAIFYFSIRVNVKIKTIIIDKRYINNKAQLSVALLDEIKMFVESNKPYFSFFDKIVIYYDNGQETLSRILNISFKTYENIEKRENFNHIDKRLFQVSDMLTVIDKLDYKLKNKMPLTKAESFFFNRKDFKHIIKLLTEKRL